MSSFAWLDFSDFERRRALEVIQRLAEHDTVDELGIGSVRDALSEILFPSTSVIHTRARYFFFVPWIYLRLEKRRVPSERISADARRAEIKLIEVLLASPDSEGTIGRRARAALKILPSAIYWQALHRLGIRSFRGPRDRYHRSIDRFYANRIVARRNDDNEIVERFRVTNWDQHLPEIPADFPESATLALRKLEAEYLRERIIFSAPKTLYRYLVESGEPVADCVFPWEHPSLSKLPPHVQEQLQHSRNFSEVIHSTALLYNLMLARLEKNDEKTEEYTESLDKWRVEFSDRAAPLKVWNLNRFWQIAFGGGTRILPSTRLFIDSWINLIRESGGTRLQSNKTAQQMIIDRERQLKRGQARLENKRARELWSGHAGIGRLTYRWDIARQMLIDIETALER